MKRSILAVLIGLLFPITAFAADFPITASIPAATVVNYVVSQVNPDGGAFTPNGGLSLNFATAGGGLKYDNENNIWVGSRYFAIDLSPSNGTNPAPGTYGSIDFAYSAQVVPAGQPATEGLNKRATLTAVRVNADASETLVRKGIVGSTFATITDSEVAGGFVRVYVGLATGDPAAGIPGAVPFTNADKPGTYTGTLTITATLI